MKKQQWVQCAPLGALALLVLGACDSSNDQALDSQAIDGYIVGGTVSCDGEDAGVTAAGGWMTCPEGTKLVTVLGGMDVGFDVEATESSIPFIGKLTAPANLGYVTPLTTIAVRLATTEDGYDDTLWHSSVKSLASVLNVPELDLAADASQDMDLIRLNAQLQQVLSAFVRSEADYEGAIDALATVVAARDESGSTIDLQDEVADTLIAINTALQVNYSEIALGATELESLAVTIQAANIAIAEAGSPDLVAATAAANSVELALVTIDRSAQAVTLTSYDDVQYITSAVSIDDFESSTLSNGSYMTQVDRNLDEVGYDNSVLQFDEDLNNVGVTMAFELKSTTAGDSRSLSFVSDDVRLTASAGQPDSLVITLPDGATFDAVGTDSQGTVTTAETMVDGRDTFSNRSGAFYVNYSQIVEKLESLGFENIFASAGNYEMTLLIGGIRINERSGSTVVPALRYVIAVGDRQVIGSGFKGYLSYLH
ncbi:MAG: hypothetical protein HKN42_15780 [Granulosicoccus sp.]|nr:hypothetical protein [Granulosicoccus sp.]